jgi:hypothetical protein
MAVILSRTREVAVVVHDVWFIIPLMTHLLRLNLQFHLSMANMILLYILIENWR